MLLRRFPRLSRIIKARATGRSRPQPARSHKLHVSSLPEWPASPNSWRATAFTRDHNAHCLCRHRGRAFGSIGGPWRGEQIVGCTLTKVWRKCEPEPRGRQTANSLAEHGRVMVMGLGIIENHDAHPVARNSWKGTTAPCAWKLQEMTLMWSSVRLGALSLCEQCAEDPEASRMKAHTPSTRSTKVLAWVPTGRLCSCYSPRVRVLRDIVYAPSEGQ